MKNFSYLCSMLNFLQKYEKYIGWFLRGSFLQVYFKWVVFGYLLALLVIFTCYPYTNIYQLKPLFKAEFFITLYVALIPALVSRRIR